MGSGIADKITAASARISRASILFDKASCVFLHQPLRTPARTEVGTHTREPAGGGKDTVREIGRMKLWWPIARADASFAMRKNPRYQTGKTLATCT